ncbi:type II toxin-antitoxin system HicA family toxin [Thermococcus sp. 21S7]|uniref:type II toxin-antitoxin system HicA family toxin n=1 Tax=Thermococcus sp. 21S7 TaxID=1638221 RepID=UPI00143BC8A5|nr:type II toxin-antitoxin system HicA family toxin [Thermococcus sp. 21S7]NJE61666.1 addiction module toxin, HicA family [Thermococcus sp. 21S7]
MSKLPRLSGEEVIKVLTRKFGFEVSRQRGSQVVLVKYIDGRKIGTVVPLHKELKAGTLMGVLRLAQISKGGFHQGVGRPIGDAHGEGRSEENPSGRHKARGSG